MAFSLFYVRGDSMRAVIVAVLALLLCSPAQAYKCGSTKIVIDSPYYAADLEMAGALYDMDRRVIALSSRFMARAGRNVARFVFAHECGHHINRGGSEIAADNYALTVVGKSLTKADVATICGDVGPARCRNIRAKLK